MTTRRARLSPEAILAEARALLTTGGPAAVSLRRLATRLGVTAPALYLHFPSKDALLAAIADDEFARLIEVIEAAGTRSADPVTRIKAQSHAYVARALESPTLFAVLFASRPPWGDAADGDASPLGAKAWRVASQAVEDAIARGDLGEQDPLLASLTIWSAAHGVATLLLAGPRLGAGYEARLVDSAIDAVVDGLASRGTRRGPGPGS